MPVNRLFEKWEQAVVRDQSVPLEQEHQVEQDHGQGGLKIAGGVRKQDTGDYHVKNEIEIKRVFGSPRIIDQDDQDYQVDRNLQIREKGDPLMPARHVPP